MRDEAPADPITAYNAAFAAYNDGDGSDFSEAAYMQACERMNEYDPATPRDFIRKFIAMWKESGYPDERRIGAMLACGVRMVGEA